MDVKQLGALGKVRGLDGLDELARPSGADAAQGGSFGKLLEDSISQVQSLQKDADKAIESLATGGPATLHDTMLALQKADLSFRLMMQVRNKIVEAYHEVLRMQV
jgi:flagellar hook-basal body complex protein FliE